MPQPAAGKRRIVDCGGRAMGPMSGNLRSMLSGPENISSARAAVQRPSSGRASICSCIPGCGPDCEPPGSVRPDDSTCGGSPAAAAAAPLPPRPPCLDARCARRRRSLCCADFLAQLLFEPWNALSGSRRWHLPDGREEVRLVTPLSMCARGVQHELGGDLPLAPAVRLWAKRGVHHCRR